MNSMAMEMEGLKRGLEKLKELGVALESLVTDRHVQINNYMKINHPEVNHYYDCWHVVKCKLLSHL